MNPTLIGYFPKQTLKDTSWLNNPGIDQICSASECMSKGPTDWINKWLHNDMWVFDSAEIAWSIVPAELRNSFDLYAYRMFPVQFVLGEQKPFEIPPLKVQPLDPSFHTLGFDPVSRSLDNCFECSPLSCCHMAQQIVVNRNCLLDQSNRAFELAKEFSNDGIAEPGPYYIVEVLRRESD